MRTRATMSRSCVGRQGNERTIGAYVKQQGTSYQKLHEDRQLALF